MDKGENIENEDIIRDKITSDPDEIATSAYEVIEISSKDLAKFKEWNADVDKTNLRIWQAILESLVTTAKNINNMIPVDRETYFYIVHNATILTYDI